MGISSDIEAKRRSYSHAPRCKLGELLSPAMRLSPTDHQALQDAIALVRKDQELPQAKRYYTVAWLHSVLVNNHHPIGKTVVSEHVRKVCACEQDGQ